MAVRFYQVVVDAHDPSRLAHWWADVLGYEVLYETTDEVIIGVAPDRYPGICFVPVGDAKATKNRLHIDLGQGDAAWTVLADPEGNEFCILTPHRSLID